MTIKAQCVFAVSLHAALTVCHRLSLALSLDLLRPYGQTKGGSFEQINDRQTNSEGWWLCYHASSSSSFLPLFMGWITLCRKLSRGNGWDKHHDPEVSFCCIFPISRRYKFGMVTTVIPYTDTQVLQYMLQTLESCLIRHNDLWRNGFPMSRGQIMPGNY